MEFIVKSGHAPKQRSACIVVGIFERRKLSPAAEALDEKCAHYISNIVRRGDIEGKLGQMLLLPLFNVPETLCDRVLLVGCGKERELGEEQYRDIFKKTVTFLNETGAMEAVCFLPSDINLKGRDHYWKIRFGVEASLETLYSFNEFKSKKDPTRRPLRKLTMIVPTRRELLKGEQAVQHGEAIASAIATTKNLANTPPNICTPEYLANYCKKLEKDHKNIATAILKKDDMKALNMGAFLSVAQGSSNDPRLITMEYSGAKKTNPPIVFVGKGITFDSGGHSLKPAANMIGMKYDMCGAATVVGLIHAAAALKLPLNIVGVIAAAENLPGPTASRPDDVVTTMSGTTVEILNTDAEGRLVLCDAITYSERFNPETIIDIATLTGACVVALGHEASGLYSNHNPLSHELLNAGTQSGDRAWAMPLWDEYAKQLQSNIADLANIGNAGEAGSITAACFLHHFAKKHHWAHLDVAGTAAIFQGKSRGATGRPVSMLIQFLLNRIANNK